MLAACAPTQGPSSGQPGAGPSTGVVVAPPSTFAQGSPSALAPDGTLKAALLLPRTGAAAAAGATMLNAARLAVEGGCPTRVVVTPYDTASTPDGARAAAAAALADGSTMILGPLFSAEVEAVAPLAQASGVPVLAFSSDRRRAGSGTWVLGQLPSNEVERAVRWARDQGATRFAVVAPQNPLGEAAVEAMRATTTQLGVQLVREGLYPAGGSPLEAVQSVTDFGARYAGVEAEIRKLRQQDTREARARIAELQRRPVPPAPYDAALVAEQGDQLLLVSAMLAHHFGGVSDARLLGLSSLASDRAAWQENSLAGAVFAAPDPAEREGFARAYQAANGAAPGPLAAVAHQAVGIVCTLGAEPTPNRSAASLTRAQGFNGAAGRIVLLPDGTNARPLTLFRVERGRVEAIEPPLLAGLPGG